MASKLVLVSAILLGAEANDQFFPVNIFIDLPKVEARVNLVTDQISWRIKSMTPEGVKYKISNPVRLLLDVY